MDKSLDTFFEDVEDEFADVANYEEPIAPDWQRVPEEDRFSEDFILDIGVEMMMDGDTSFVGPTFKKIGEALIKYSDKPNLEQSLVQDIREDCHQLALELNSDEDSRGLVPCSDEEYIQDLENLFNTLIQMLRKAYKR